MEKKILVLWSVILILILLSSCAFNLFSDFELEELLSEGTTEQKIESAQNALSCGNYNAAIVLAAFVINQELGLNLKVEDLERLLDSTPTVHQLVQALQDTTPTEDLIEAVEILVEAVAYKTKKDVTNLSDSIYELLQELGVFASYSGKAFKGSSDFWEEFETNAATIVALLSKFFDGRNCLKILVGGYRFITVNTNEDRDFSAALCVFYDICYMFNLILDLNNDGNVTDEQFVKGVVNDPDSIVDLSKEATSGLYNDPLACDEFVWACEVLKDMFDILNIEANVPIVDSTTLSQKQKIYDVFTIIFGSEDL